MTFRDSPSIDPQRSLSLDEAPPGPRSRTIFEPPVQAGQRQHDKQQTEKNKPKWTSGPASE